MVVARGRGLRWWWGVLLVSVDERKKEKNGFELEREREEWVWARVLPVQQVAVVKIQKFSKPLKTCVITGSFQL